MSEDSNYPLRLGRGQGSSVNLEWAHIAAGCILRGTPLTLYICQTARESDLHLHNIREFLEGEAISAFYSQFARSEVGKFSNRWGWSRTLLATQSGLTVFAVGLEEEIRGVKKQQLRAELITVDADNASAVPAWIARTGSEDALSVTALKQVVS